MRQTTTAPPLSAALIVMSLRLRLRHYIFFYFRLPVPVSLSPKNSTSLRLFSLSRATAPFSLARGAHMIHSDEGFKLEMSMVNLPY